MGSSKEAVRVLAQIWDEERLMRVRTDVPEFFFNISLASYLTGEEQAHLYRIGTTVRILGGKHDVWFHHTVSASRFRDPEACVDWNLLQPEENALVDTGVQNS